MFYSPILLSINEWTSFFGRFHPLLVHLPIGFLLLIAIIEILKISGKLEISSDFVKISLFVTGLMASLACVVGYFLSLEGGYEEEMLSEHKWQGIWMTIFCWIAWSSKNDWLTDKIGINTVFYIPSLIFATLMMFVAGHHGGNLTHGENYLTENTPTLLRQWFGMSEKKNNDKLSERTKIANVNDAMVYQDIIHPIFKEKCEQCHNKNKIKGELRMDDISLLQKGGKNGVIFKANNIAESEFIKRILLPESDEHHMPPKGKNQVSENELSLMKWWVEEGASFTKKVSQLAVNESIKPVLATLGGGMGVAVSSNSIVKQVKFEMEEKLLTAEVDAIDNNVFEEIKKSGGMILPLSQNTNYVELTYLNNAKFADNDSKLIAIAPNQTLWLKLNNTQITDKALTEVSKLSNLTRLHLQNTKITDKGLDQLKTLQNLEYLNLIGTSITDTGLQRLALLKNLKKIFLWKTKVSQVGAEKLKKSLPNLVIDLGMTEQQIATLLKAKADTISDDVYKKK
ncbi:hypothetical protein EMA8858_01098 [Emticicia aquatica]|uniref:Uncharacterized protein n=1 Tax=Emticicia aquatica TaxID=1681835 RepID=A0ABM9AME2_9BACT|nr:c-type cytochrome domain-containing protein [Emticicia aquatica]CAH0994978.1 hypothetical protein EMA8858_01098 [Emticicia aquatica]